MSVVGSVSVLLTATTDQFKAGLKAANDQLDSIGSSAGKLALGLAGAGAALAGTVTAALYGFKAMAAGMTETVHEAAKLGMGSQALQELQYAGQKAGVSAEEMTNVLGKMNVRLAEVAITGEGKAVKSLNRFGLSAKSLAQMEPDQAFMKIAEVMGKIQNPSERAAVAVDLFGRSGIQLGELMVKGAGGITALRAEADKLGIALPDAANEAAKKASGAISKIQAVFKGIMQQGIAAAAPYVEQFANNLFTGIMGVKDKITEVGSYIYTDLAEYFGYVGEVGKAVWENLGSWIGFVRDTMAGLTQAFLDFTGLNQSGHTIISNVWLSIGKGIAVVADTLQALPEIFRTIRAAFTDAFGWIVGKIGEAGSYLNEFVKKFTGKDMGFSGEFIKTWHEELNKAAEEDRKTAAAALVGESWGQKVNKWFTTVDSRVQEKLKAAEIAKPEKPGEMEKPARPKRLLGETQLSDYGVGGPIEMGSKEALESIMTAAIGGDSMSKMLDKQDEANDHLKAIAENTRQNGILQPATDLLSVAI